MTEEEEILMRELLKNAATIYANMDIDHPLPFLFRRTEIPTLRASERIRVVLIREHDEPPQPDTATFAGVLGYAEGVTA